MSIITRILISLALFTSRSTYAIAHLKAALDWEGR